MSAAAGCWGKRVTVLPSPARDGDADGTETQRRLLAEYVEYRVRRLLRHFRESASPASPATLDGIAAAAELALRLLAGADTPDAGSGRIRCECRMEHRDPPVPSPSSLGRDRLGRDLVLGSSLGEAIPRIRVRCVLPRSGLLRVAFSAWRRLALEQVLELAVPLHLDARLDLRPDGGGGAPPVRLGSRGRGDDDAVLGATWTLHGTAT